MVSEALQTTGSKVIFLADNNACPIITPSPAQRPSLVEFSKALSKALSFFFFFSTSTIFLFVPKLSVSSYSLMILIFYSPILTQKYLNL